MFKKAGSNSTGHQFHGYGWFPGNSISFLQRIMRNAQAASVGFGAGKTTARPRPMSLAGGAVKSIPALWRWPAVEEVIANWQE
jgi:hypothetical protein